MTTQTTPDTTRSQRAARHAAIFSGLAVLGCVAQVGGLFMLTGELHDTATRMDMVYSLARLVLVNVLSLAVPLLMVCLGVVTSLVLCGISKWRSEDAQNLRRKVLLTDALCTGFIVVLFLVLSSS